MGQRELQEALVVKAVLEEQTERYLLVGVLVHLLLAVCMAVAVGMGVAVAISARVQGVIIVLLRIGE